MKIWSVVLRPVVNHTDHLLTLTHCVYFQSTCIPPFLKNEEVIFLDDLFTFYDCFCVHMNDYTCLPILWCFSKFPRYLTHHVNQRAPSLLNALPHNFRSDFAFTIPDFSSRMLPLLSMRRLSPSENQSHHTYQKCCPYWRFNKSSKCSFHRKNISFSSLMMFPFESLMEVVVV